VLPLCVTDGDDGDHEAAGSCGTLLYVHISLNRLS
jgi:hypothetical protein